MVVVVSVVGLPVVGLPLEGLARTSRARFSFPVVPVGAARVVVARNNERRAVMFENLKNVSKPTRHLVGRF